MYTVIYFDTALFKLSLVTYILLTYKHQSSYTGQMKCPGIGNMFPIPDLIPTPVILSGIGIIIRYRKQPI